MAARLGLCNILQCLINGNCNLDSQTKLGDTALMKRRTMVKLFWVSIVIALVFIKLVDAYHINETELSILEAHEGYSFSSNLVNQPRMVGITFIQSAAAKGAVCLDGTLPAYHFDRRYGSGANSWIVNLEGGAWCNNVRTCVYRKTTQRGSSNFMEKAIPFTGIMSNNPRENPGFFFHATELYYA
ncbi:hypothetical protein RYX36_024644 [Vicia faba]